MDSSTGMSTRYTKVSEQKAKGATYTPKMLADFVAQRILLTLDLVQNSDRLRILDPAIGDGELLLSLLTKLPEHDNIEVHGFETNSDALEIATKRLKECFPQVKVNFKSESFLDYVLEYFSSNDNLSLFNHSSTITYDLIIANPPYVRTQILGATKARLLASQFNLSGRVDLYYAFLLAMSQVLKPKGTGGIIVSNRFMTTKSGAAVRKFILQHFNVLHAYDLGDTKLFNAAVLPAVLLVRGKAGINTEKPRFTSIYQTIEPAKFTTLNPITALDFEGNIRTEDGRIFCVKHGNLDNENKLNGVWRISTKTVNNWLLRVKTYAWGTFRDIGKIRVGVKTCADKIFIRNDWESIPSSSRPELLRPLITHHNANRFKSIDLKQPRKILYPHEVKNGNRCPIDLNQYPKAKSYLESHRLTLERRKYVVESGRAWYEIWVPQNPEAWQFPKLIFRDISEKPTFWIDLNGCVVNGDCYWIFCNIPEQTDLLWLAAAVGNSTFIERFYDYSFHNKLYAGRRRFITQYVEKFPIPPPDTEHSKKIIAKAKLIYKSDSSHDTEMLYKQLDEMVWEAFGLAVEKV